MDYSFGLVVQMLIDLKNALIAVNGGSYEDKPPLEECLLRFKRIPAADADDNTLTAQSGRSLEQFLLTRRK
jgi:hypothetical protein